MKSKVKIVVQGTKLISSYLKKNLKIPSSIFYSKVQDDEYFKPLPELLYKARNGRVFKDNDERFAFFARVALDTLKKLFWAPK